MTDNWTEPGRHVSDSGQIIYHWPPEGRFAELWARIDPLTTDEDKSILLSLLARWYDEHSTLVAFTDENGEWVGVEWNWNEVTE